VSNANGSHGLASTASVGTAHLTATLGSITGNAMFTVSSAALQEIASARPRRRFPGD